jgi:hypothetical protein
LDELRLVDGTLLRGRLQLVEDGVLLKHDVFGEIRLPGDAIREIDRYDARVVDLVDLAPTSLEQLPLTSGPVREAGLRTLRRAELGMPPSCTFVKALRIEAHTTVRYAATGNGPRTLRAEIEPPREARGVAVVRIGTSDRTLLETQVTPRGAPQRVQLRFEAGEAISIEVDFGDAIRFPCAVILADPLLLQES